ncbi:hypothetical protein N8I77_001909 [Diaporthe amygdali]|uniref:WSC domain-containing protein n=1 Tax=Phomopsis amygdali TaxID=1214568 RepID=A0AAD9SSL6_PHOAM|nr:hypothetical protein N8I77_001909 [Diaporthe amygdali]
MKCSLEIGAVIVLQLGLLPCGVSAFWRMGCSTIMNARIDPIVNPGGLSSHSHTIVGASNIGIDSSYESLINSACTSCEIQADKSAYWAPILYYQYADGSFHDVHQSGSVVYYLGRGPNVGKTIPFPEGFKMISGTTSARSLDTNTYTWGDKGNPPRLVAEAINFACLGANRALPEENGLNNTSWTPFDCINGLRAQIHFPTCWNGVDLYKVDGSHVTHMNQIDNGACPESHPHQLPHIFLETLYSVDSIPGDIPWRRTARKIVNIFQTNGRFVFSNGDSTGRHRTQSYCSFQGSKRKPADSILSGYGYHGDFINGWNSTVQALAMANCLATDNSGLISSCPYLQESDTDGYSSNCPLRKSPVNETVLGLLAKLPGCNRVTEGPLNAKPGDSTCPSSVTPPYITPTVNSVAQYTVRPSIGSFYPPGSQQEYLGCFNDTTGGQRALDGKRTSMGAMDVSTCQAYCNTLGYRLSGVEYSTECYCDNMISNSANTNHLIAGFDQCTWLCSATIARDNGTQEICGGYAFISIYNNTDPLFGQASSQPYPNSYIGCASDTSSSRSLQGASTSASGMTVDACAAFAQTGNSGAGYKYFGVEFGSECFIGNTLMPSSKILSETSNPPSTSCNMQCSGEDSQICGGAGLLSLYYNPNYTANSAFSPNIGSYQAIGCLTDSQSSKGLRSLAAASSYSDDMTEDKCVAFCHMKGYRYAG